MTELADGEQAHDALRFLPGGRMAVFTVYQRTGDATDPEIWALDLETGQRTMLTQGTAPRYTSTGHLLYVRTDGMLIAAPIDDEAEIGPAVSLFGGIQVVNGVARYAVSSAGALAYIAGGTQEDRTSLVWVDREGREQPLPLESQLYAYPRISPDGGRLAVAVVADDPDLWVFDLDRLTRSSSWRGTGSSSPRPGRATGASWRSTRDTPTGPRTDGTCG